MRLPVHVLGIELQVCLTQKYNSVDAIHCNCCRITCTNTTTDSCYSHVAHLLGD